MWIIKSIDNDVHHFSHDWLRLYVGILINNEEKIHQVAASTKMLYNTTLISNITTELVKSYLLIPKGMQALRDELEDNPVRSTRRI